jgi:hypothetical protein
MELGHNKHYPPTNDLAYFASPFAMKKVCVPTDEF